MWKIVHQFSYMYLCLFFIFVSCLNISNIFIFHIGFLLEYFKYLNSRIKRVNLHPAHILGFSTSVGRWNPPKLHFSVIFKDCSPFLNCINCGSLYPLSKFSRFDFPSRQFSYPQFSISCENELNPPQTKSKSLPITISYMYIFIFAASRQ